MKVYGGGSVLEVGPEDEGCHDYGPDELWQESVVMFWWDKKVGVGGLHRIGHEPNVKGSPQVMLWNYIFHEGKVYKNEACLPLREMDRGPNFLGCGDDSCRFEFGDHAKWTINAADIEAELHVYDSHTPVDVYPKSGMLATDVAPNHMEVAGFIKGNVSIAGKECAVDGLAFRDHGWGNRDWSAFVGHRWVAGVLEDGSMVFGQTFHSRDDNIVKFGVLIRDGELIYADQVDIIVYLEADGISHRGGFLEMTLQSGELVRLDAKPLSKGVISWIHGIASVDVICDVSVGDLKGICNFEVSSNPLRGKQKPTLALTAAIENGWSN